MASFQNEDKIGLQFYWTKFGTGSGFGIRDSGFGIRDSGFGIRDSGFGIRDSGFGILTFSRSHVLTFSRSHVRDEGLLWITGFLWIDYFLTIFNSLAYAKNNHNTRKPF